MIEAAFTVLFAALSFIYSATALSELQLNAYRTPPAYGKKSSAESGAITAAGAATVVLAAFSPLAGTIAAIIFVFGLLVYFAWDYRKKRTKFKLTKRGVRLLFSVYVFLAVLHTAAGLTYFKPFLFYLLHFSVLIFARPAAFLINFSIRPLENLNNARYVKQAREKLSALKAVKIGITGSFGKTSCKNILAAMLEKKYKVLKTEGNYNTPMGICLAAKEIKGDEEIFIAEMGARRTGDIRELCEIVRPTYAIITGVSSQHLESFKTEENIYKTKKELIDCLPPEGFAVFNGDNENSREMRKSAPCPSVLVRLEAKNEIHAENIRLSGAGSKFEIVNLGEAFFNIDKASRPP